MDTKRQVCYSTFHETTWKSCNIRATAAEGHCSATTRLHVSRRIRTTRSLVELRRSMVSKLSAVRAPWFGGAAHTRSALPSKQPPARSPWRSAGAWRAGGRVSQRTVDAETNWRHRGENLWCALLPISHLATLGHRVAVERSKARTARHAARRGRHRLLETLRLAAYKKKPGNGAHTWHSLTKAGFCLFPPSGERGRRSAKLRFCDTATGGIGSRLFRASRSRPVAIAWPCMRNSIAAISPEKKWLCSCVNCCDKFGVQLTWCGMADRFIAGARWEYSCVSIADFIHTDSPPMPRKLIPMNMSGRNPSNGSQMQHRLPLIIWSIAFGVRSKGSDDPSACCGPASMKLTCRGNDVSIT